MILSSPHPLIKLTGHPNQSTMAAAPNQSNDLLTGRMVVIVDPENLRPGYGEELKVHGAESILCPPVEIAELESYEQLDDAIDHLYGYDWLLFTSVAGVESFLRRLREKGFDSSALDELRVCAADEATEKRLLEEHIHVDVAASVPVSKKIFTTLESFVGGLTGFSGLNFLSPRAVVARDSLTRALHDAGARVDLVRAYRIQLSPEFEDPGRTAAMISAAADCIVLTSPTSVAHLTRLFDTQDLAEALAKVSVISFDEATTTAALDHRLHVKALTTPASAAMLAQIIAEEFPG